MAELEKLGIKVPFRDVAAPRTSTGAAEAWASIADASARFASVLGNMADKAAIREGEMAGLEHASTADIPGGVADPAAPPEPDRPAMGMSFTGAPPKPAPAGKGAAGSPGAALAFFMAKGWSREQAAGIVGNLMQESGPGLNTKALGDRTIPGGSVGIAQWNRDRKARLMAFAQKRGTDWHDFSTQLEYVQHELATTETGAAANLRKARTVEQATAAFIGYERPAGWTPANPRGGHGFNNRLRFAMNALGLDTSGTSIPASAPPPVVAGTEPAAAGTVARPAATQPFTLTRSATLRGQAFDKAATGVYADRLEVQAITDITTIASRTPDDPAATAEAIRQYGLQNRASVPPEVRPAYDNLLARHGLTFTQAAARQHGKKLADEAEASFLQNYEAKRTGLVRMAANAAFTPEGNAALATELQSVQELVEGTQGLTPKERVSLQRDLTDDVMSARVMAGFQNRTSPEGRQLYAEALQITWTEGKGEARAMSPEAFARVQGQMRAALNADATALRQRVAAVDRGMDAALARVKSGYDIPAPERAALKAAVAGTGDPVLARNLSFLDGLANWQAANRGVPPQQIASQIAAYERDIAERGATADDVVALDVMKGLHKAMVEGLDKDPLGFAEQAGVIRVPPIDLSSADAFAATLGSRADAAEAVAGTYGTRPRYFRPAERAALATAVANNPDMLVSFGPAIRNALGDATPQALAEISKDAPVLAHVSGLSIATGDDRFLRETAQALKLRLVEGHQPVKAPATVRVALPALQMLPGTEAATTQTAELVFDLRASAMGLDPAASPETAQTLWAETVNEALGAVTRDGVTRGGLGLVNGGQVLLPPGLSEDELQDAMDGISPSTLELLPPFATLNGFDITADHIAMGKLVAVAPFTYRLALGDPQSRDPQYLMAPDGDFWSFDIRRLMANGGGGGF